MSRKTCFDPSRSLHDRRFRRKLSGWEFKDFLFLLWFAADECRDPAFIPAPKISDLAMELEMTGKDGRAKFAQRLAKWSAPGIELITLEADGGIQINYVLDQDVEASEASAYSASVYAPPLAAGGNGHSPAGNGTNGNGANGSSPSNGNSNSNSNGNGYPVSRRPRKNESSTRGAEGKRYAYWQAKADTTGQIYVYDGITFTPKGQETAPEDHEVSEVSAENSRENLAASQSKPPVNTGESGEKDGDFSPRFAEVSSENSLAGASRVTVVRGSKDSNNSDYSTLTVARDQNLAETSEPKPPTKTSEASQTSDSPQTLQASSASAPKLSGPIRPLPRPVYPPQAIPAVQSGDVKDMIKVTGDDAAWRNQWVALWRHCHRVGQLRCWDEAVAIFAWRLQVSPPPGRPGSVGKPSVFVRGTIWALLKDAGAPYVPASQASSEAAASQEPVDPAEAEEVRRSIQETKARWAVEENTSAKTVITPLNKIFEEDILDARITPLEDLHAEMEDE